MKVYDIKKVIVRNQIFEIFHISFRLYFEGEAGTFPIYHIYFLRPLKHILFESSNQKPVGYKDKKGGTSLIFTHFSKSYPVHCVNAKNV